MMGRTLWPSQAYQTTEWRGGRKRVGEDKRREREGGRECRVKQTLLVL
jgi:hypothetical protein